MPITFGRELQSPAFMWRDTISSELSVPDIITYLGRATPRRTFTFTEGLRSLPVGYVLSSEKGRNQIIGRKWSPIAGPLWEGSSEEDIAEAIRVSLRDSVRFERSNARRIGLLLSGGFDSTLLAILLKELDADIRCYVVEYTGRWGPKESGYAHAVAQQLGITCKTVSITPKNFDSMLKELMLTASRPLTCWSAVNQLAASRAAVEDGCDVLISGLGSDELFSGYHKIGAFSWRFRALCNRIGIENAWKQLLGPRSRQRTHLLYIGQACPFPRVQLKTLFPSHDIESYLEDDVVELFQELHIQYPKADLTALILQLEIELRTAEMLWPDFNLASSLAGISVRYPYFSPRILECAANIDINLRYRYEDSPNLKHRPPTKAIDKYILRLAFQDIVPERIQLRHRLTYTAPFGSRLLDQDYLSKISQYVQQSKIWDECGADRRVLAELMETRTKFDAWSWPFQVWVLYQLVCWKDGETSE